MFKTIDGGAENMYKRRDTVRGGRGGDYTVCKYEEKDYMTDSGRLE
jgi:hypothetical protein